MAADTDVLVVGAGPVGLMLAGELGRHGVRCQIVDRLAARADACKAIGVQPRTLEIWEDAGVVTPMIDAGIWLKGQQLFVNGQATKTGLAYIPEVPYQFLGLPQYETERLLEEHLATFGTTIRRGVELRQFREDADGIIATLATTAGGTEEVRARYLAGCDGAHSAVRHGLGLAFDGDAYGEAYMLGDVEVDWVLPDGYAYRFVHVAGGKTDDFLVAVPLPGRRRFRMSMFAPPALASPASGDAVEHGFLLDRPPPTLAQLQEGVDRLAPPGARLQTLRWSSFFRISHRLVPRYQVGRAFLAGDAAHIHPPTGGQGMNTGLQDAYNLAWKLALAVQGVASSDLLDSYHAERQPVGQEVVSRTDRYARAQREGQPPSDRDFLRDDSMLYLGYRDSAWVGEDLAAPDLLVDGPRPGDRAPDVRGLRREGIGFPLRLFDLLRGPRHTLLLYADGSLTADERADLARAAALTTERARGRTAIYAVVGPGAEPDDFRELHPVQDPAGTFRQAYGADTPCLFLIRPDGYVGYRAAPIRPTALAAYLDRIFRP
jgi:2-polyprenyl-6-methoxyphenol hydroxylase-like FAD-dependent oxidoreductase